MAILVTGGAGFIGANFVLDWFSHTDETIITLDKLTYAGHLENLQALDHDKRHLFVRGDIADQTLVKQLLHRHAVRAIVHFAAESHVDRSIDHPHIFMNTNVVGTFLLLESTRSYWQTLDRQAASSFRFVHVSTDEVYGSLDHQAPPCTEDHPYCPNGPYSASKAASDHFVRAYHHTYGLPVLTTHCSNNYGPYQFPEKLIPLCIKNALAHEPLPLYGDGQQIRDWLYVQDHCCAIRHILDAGIIGNVYNISGYNERTNAEVVTLLCTILDHEQPRADAQSYTAQITYVQDRLGHDRRYAIDAGKLSKELHWMPTETFETGLYKTVHWYLGHQNWIHTVTSHRNGDWVRNAGAQ